MITSGNSIPSAAGGGFNLTQNTPFLNVCNTVYHNTGTTTKIVTVTFIKTLITAITRAYVNTDNPPTAEVVRILAPFTNQNYTFTFCVPAGYYYEIVDADNPQTPRWTEWS